MDSGAVAPGSVELEAEKERTLATLMTFKKFDLPIFDGEDVDPWIVEMWIDSMETLFEKLYTLERDKVPLAVHCLKQSAKAWWKGIRRDRSPSLPPMAWDEFRGLMFSTYFPDNERRKLRDKFRKLRQGDCSVREYERKFSRIVNCVPDVERDDRDKADWFLRGLRPEIYRRVQIFQLTTFAEVLDRALWAEHGEAFVREERESRWHERGEARPLSSGSGDQSSSRHRSRSSSTRSSSGCVICGGSHQARRCALRDGRCIRCGQPGHVRDECPQSESQALMLATAHSSLGQPPGRKPRDTSESLAMVLGRRMGLVVNVKWWSDSQGNEYQIARVAP
ncbi:uncharacterized protein LOC109714128 [Ananas comosus]|uniref:Uncharacterized protein LOC109714128 n=1 Tax=Ananas comosus TaxID=4615 RepID=A0A6P5FEX1_ANACO|nr:uncharacterized protein LOC109714128 [Ananas comosus]